MREKRTGSSTLLLAALVVLLVLATVVLFAIPLADCPVCTSGLDAEFLDDPCGGKRKVTLIQRWRHGPVTATLDER